MGTRPDTDLGLTVINGNLRQGACSPARERCTPAGFLAGELSCGDCSVEALGLSPRELALRPSILRRSLPAPNDVGGHSRCEERHSGDPEFGARVMTTPELSALTGSRTACRDRVFTSSWRRVPGPWFVRGKGQTFVFLLGSI